MVTWCLAFFANATSTNQPVMLHSTWMLRWQSSSTLSTDYFQAAMISDLGFTFGFCLMMWWAYLWVEIYIETLKNKPSPFYSTQLTLPTQYPRCIIRRLQYKPANIPCNLPLQNWTQIRLGTIHHQPWSIYLKVLLLAMKKGLKRKGWTEGSISGDIPVSTGMLVQVECGAIDPKWVDIHITFGHWWRTFLHCWNVVTLMSTVRFLGLQCLFR